MFTTKASDSVVTMCWKEDYLSRCGNVPPSECVFGQIIIILSMIG